MLDVLPIVSTEKQLALHGGTAINMFVRDMPRLSVDIDLTYLPIEDRTTSLAGITSILLRLEQKIKRSLGCSVEPKLKDGKLYISNEQASIKLEINLVGRGVIDELQTVVLCDRAQRRFNMFVEINMVPLGQLYGGKICAALDRQHPRDLFDVKYMLETIGLSDEIKRGMIYCLLGSARPTSEMLHPNRLNQKGALLNQFDGMTDDPFTYEDYETTKEELIKLIYISLTELDRKFLIGFNSLQPDWSIYPYQNLPSVKWKLLNLEKLQETNPAKFDEHLDKLKAILS